MYRRLIPGAVALVTSIGASHSHAADLIISPQVSSGVTYIDYRQEAGIFSGTSFSDFNVTGFLPFLAAGLSAVYSPFYFSVYGQQTFEEPDDSDTLTVTNQPASTIPPFGQRLSLDSEFSRSEVQAIVGYQIKDPKVFGAESAFHIFAGYKYADTDIDNKVAGKSNVPGVLPFPFSVNGDLDIDLTYHGPLAGIRYTFPVHSLAGMLSFSSAVTYYRADINLKFNPSAGTPISPRKGDDDAKSIGYNFQIGWLGNITGDLYYSLGVDTSKSDFDTDGNVSDFSETEYRFYVGLEYGFTNIGSLFGLGR
jgi:hypothetical protein